MKQIDNISNYFHDLLETKDLKNSINSNELFIIYLSFLFSVLSLNKYSVIGILQEYFLFFIFLKYLDLSFFRILNKVKLFLVPVLFFGIFNIFFDKSIAFQYKNIIFTKGSISFINIFLKGIFSVSIGHAIIKTIGIKGICNFFLLIKLPNKFIYVFLIIIRYIENFLLEISAIIDAYSIKNLGQTKIDIRHSGGILGTFVYKSFDMAEDIYNSFLLHGGVFVKEDINVKFTLNFFIFISLILIFRIFNIFRFVSIFGRHIWQFLR